MLPLPFDLIMGGEHHCTPQNWQRSEPISEGFHRIYFPLHGAGWIERDGTRIPLQPGSIALIPGYRPITHGCDKVLDLTWMHFHANDGDTELALAATDRCFRFEAKIWKHWRPIWLKLQKLFAGKPRILQKSQSLHYQAQAMLLCFIADLSDELVAPTTHSTTETANDLCEALKYMDRHYREHPHLEDVAQQVNLSPTHLHRLFRQQFGFSPHNYMLRRRMEQAYRLLSSGQMNVNEAADATGYESPFYFSRAFKKFFGFPPSKARDDQRSPLP